MNNESTFTCAHCKGEFSYEWSDEEALAEMRENFGELPEYDRAVVCDDCYKRMMDWRLNPKSTDDVCSSAVTPAAATSAARDDQGAPDVSWVTTVVIAGRYVPREAAAMLDEGYRETAHDGTDGRHVSFGNLSSYEHWDNWRGGKGPESDVFGGAFNYLDAEQLRAWLGKVPWYGRVAVIVMPEEGHQQVWFYGDELDDS